MYTKTESDYSYLGEPSTAMKLRKWGTTILLVLYGVLLLTLFVLVATVNDEDSTSPSGALGNFPITSVVPAQQVGHAVSLSSSGETQLGGGTSVYKDQYQLSSVCAKMPAIEPVFDSSYVMTFIDGTTDSTTVTILESKNARDLQYSFSSQYDKQLAAISTLDATAGLLVGIAQDVSEDEDEAVVVVMIINSDTQAVSFGAEEIYGGQYSVNPQITRLSASSFALTYLDNVTTADGAWQYSAIVKQGTVNPDNSITLSPPVIFASDDNYELHTRVNGLDSTSFLLVTNSAELDSPEGFSYGPLQARVASVVADVNGANIISLGNISTFSQNFAAFNMGSARVDDSNILLAYSDYSSNFGISVVNLQVSTSGVVWISAALPLTSGQALSEIQTDLQMDLDLAVFDSNHFVVIYSDITNGGIVTSATGHSSASGELKRDTPDLLISSSGNADTDSIYQWHAIAALANSKLHNSEISIISSVQGSNCNTASSGLSVSVMHVLPAPVGVVAGASREVGGISYADIQLSGWKLGYDNLIPGKLYYTNTFGELSASDAYCGQVDDGVVYLDDDSSSSLMTGLVGVAVSENNLLLKV